MASKALPTGTARLQVYISDPTVLAALEREAKVEKAPISKVAGRAIARGLKRSVPADPDDRLLALERRLSDHMRATSRDLQITQELQVENTRVLIERLPETVADRDPLARAAVNQRIERMYDDVASRVARGRPANRHGGPVPGASSGPSSGAPAE